MRNIITNNIFPPLALETQLHIRVVVVVIVPRCGVRLTVFSLAVMMTYLKFIIYCHNHSILTSFSRVPSSSRKWMARQNRDLFKQVFEYVRIMPTLYLSQGSSYPFSTARPLSPLRRRTMTTCSELWKRTMYLMRKTSRMHLSVMRIMTVTAEHVENSWAEEYTFHSNTHSPLAHKGLRAIMMFFPPIPPNPPASQCEAPYGVLHTNPIRTKHINNEAERMNIQARCWDLLFHLLSPTTNLFNFCLHMTIPHTISYNGGKNQPTRYTKSRFLDHFMTSLMPAPKPVFLGYITSFTIGWKGKLNERL